MRDGDTPQQYSCMHFVEQILVHPLDNIPNTYDVDSVHTVEHIAPIHLADFHEAISPLHIFQTEIANDFPPHLCKRHLETRATHGERTDASTPLLADPFQEEEKREGSYHGKSLGNPPHECVHLDTPFPSESE